MSVLEYHPSRHVGLGATLADGGVHFGLFSRNATSVTLCIFADAADGYPHAELTLDPERHRTGDIWHCTVRGLAAGALYLYRVDGPYDPESGHRFHPGLYLLDPYAKALTGEPEWRIATQFGYDPTVAGADAPRGPARDAGGVPKCVVVDDQAFEWNGDRPLNRPLRHTIIYEMHVRGFTAAADVQNPGTYRGMIERVPYLTELGVTAVELLPVHEFDRRELSNRNPDTGQPLTNYWGYSSLGFFAPAGYYATDSGNGSQVTEFKQMVKALHEAEIEVILDVVYNHTGEGDHLGPTVSFRGLDNSIYYMLQEDRRRYRNFAGTGNVVNCNHPVVQNLILDSLQYWVTEMHVDGFRFDLASILSRDQNGHLVPRAPVIERIAEDPVLRSTKLIAEAWDAGGGYQVGAFPGDRWAEWNDRFRDDVRRYWRGDLGMTAGFATRLAGSSDLYYDSGRRPFHSVNYVTAHDGFTLRDLVSYTRKHNRRNGEGDADGMGENHSFNYGVEGSTTDAQVLATRLRQQKNFLVSLMLSLGTPMLLGGDEFGRTQQGNNNAYCQDNELSWFDWNLAHEHEELLRFAQAVIRLRRDHPIFQRSDFYTGTDGDLNRLPDITWFDAAGNPVDWSRIGRTLALRIDGSHAEIQAEEDDNDFFIIFNGSTRRVSVTVCTPPEGKQWYRVIDTALSAPDDVILEGSQDRYIAGEYVCVSRSVVAFLSR